jgi:hypothetical protein
VKSAYENARKKKNNGEKRKMQISKNKTKAITIATFLVLTITVSLLALPIANAHSPPYRIPTWTYIGVTPALTGVNQNVLIVFWQNFCPPTANGAYGDRWYFNIDVTKPDGVKEVLGPFVSDPVGGSWVSYTPTQVGTYTLVAKFQEKVLNNQPYGMNPSGTYTGSSMPNVTAWLGDIFEASTSGPVTLVVQQEQMQKYVETPLPSGYWTRPVYGFNQYWGPIMGQWLNFATPSNRLNAYSEGPESAHILWSRPYWLGGVMGGGPDVNQGNIAFYTGSSYEGFGGPSIILDGKFYYSISGGAQPNIGWYCVDLYTGKTLYYENNTNGHSAMPSYGQVLNIENPNQHGGMAYLWRTSGVVLPPYFNASVSNTWEMLDAFTGKSIAKIGNVSTSGTAFTDEIGSLCYLNIANRGNTTNPYWRMTVWNTTHTMWYNPTYYTTSATNAYWYWRPATTSGNPAMPYPRVFNGIYGYSLNVTCPAVQGSIRQIVKGKYVIGGTTGNITTNPGQNTAGNLWALSLEPGKEGTLLWNFTFTPTAGLGDNAIQSYQFSSHDTSFGGVDADAGIFWYQNTMLMTRYIYSLDKDKTGKDQGTLMWTSTEDQWNFYGLSTGVYDGKVFNWGGYGGMLTAYNATTGQKLWNWSAPYVGVGETPYTHTPLSLGAIAEGKLYLYTSEHSISQPVRRDAKIYCVDATTGQMLWAIPCWPSSGTIIADGRIIALDLIDNMIYCYGPGNSKTTVSAPQAVPALGSSVTLTGTVTDDTPSGRLNTNAAGTTRFDSLDFATGDYDFVLRGTPAISDADQEAWMDYLFHQRPLPANAKGVEVTLDALDPNNNYIHIGTVTSTASGTYGFLWTPEVPGTYHIIATFAGSAAYGPSYSETYMSVGEAPPTPAEPQPEPAQPPLDMYLLYATVAIIVAIAIVGLLLLRKK